ncbi:MAG TPA: helix-turn-helix domain-containing protein [Oceanobacillus sp.]|nr:helix-turn-helix domain-containing protein [Oceanobacillus sp.]
MNGERGMMQTVLGKRGILNPKTGETKFHLSRHLPSPDLAFFVQRYWYVCWDLDEPYRQEVIQYPCVNLVFEQGKSGIFGIPSTKSSHLLEGRGKVFAVKFNPGAFYPFEKMPISQLTDTCMDIEQVFGEESRCLEHAVLSTDDVDEMIRLTECFLRERLPERDDNVVVVNQIIDCIMSDRTITKVDDLVERIGIHKRSLQRLFRQYVGVSPKWVIQRFRLHEAAELLVEGQVSDLTRMALDLGYFDQAHFIKDFKTVVGKTPAEYARQAE